MKRISENESLNETWPPVKQMTISLFLSTRLLAVIATGVLFYPQLALAAGCDLPMFAGARLFGAAASGGIEFMATGDFNHDGFLDVVTTDGNNTVSVLLGNGDGSFQPAVSYSVPQPQNMAVAHFNRDGKLDLAIWSSSSMVVMLGNGDGTFRVPIAASAQGGAPVDGDFNGDGIPDLAITGAPAYILLGNGDGTFQPPVFNGNAFFAGFGVAVGDFNGDGKLDVIAGSNDGIFVMLGDGRGNLSTPVDVAFGANPTQAAVGDFNGDHKLDVAVLDSLGGNFWVLLGNGDGTFQPATSYPMSTAQGLASGMLVADLNGDGNVDVAVTGATPLPGVQFLYAPGTILVFSGNGDGTFQPAVQYNPSGQVNSAEPGRKNSGASPKSCTPTSAPATARNPDKRWVAHETAVPRITVFPEAPLAHCKARQRPVVRDLARDGITRAAIGAVGERISVAPILRTTKILQAVVAGGDVR